MVVLVVVVVVLVVVFLVRGIDCTTDGLVDDSVVVAYTMVGLFVVNVRLMRGMLCTTDTCSCNGDMVVALKPVPFEEEYETLFISPLASTKPNVPLMLPKTSRLST